jgi:poly(3-hydroxybutyrate) depolymerase
MKKYILFAFALIIIQINVNAQYCTDDNRFTQTPVFTDAQIDYDTGVVYGNALNYQGVNQDLLLNICYPSSSVDTFTKRPLIILMHGGGFSVGSRNDMNSMCIEFSKRGFVAATIGYRLGWDTGMTGCGGDTISNEKAVYRGFQDAHAALRYLVANAAAYKIDTAWIFCGGESAGGVNSLNLAFTSQNEWNSRLPSFQAELGDINNSGNSLTNTFSLKAVFNNWGSIVETDFITADDAIPMIAFHGDMDQCLPIDYGTYNTCPNYVHLYGSRTIYNKLQALGVCAELTVKPGGDHGIYDETPAQDIFRVNRASCFFKSLFCNNCSSAYLTDSIAPDCTPAGINDIENNTGISVYPNPTNGKFSIQISGDQTAVGIFNIYNVLGENIYSAKNSQQEIFDIDISNSPKGLYFIKINCGETIYSRKVVIQ